MDGISDDNSVNVKKHNLDGDVMLQFRKFVSLDVNDNETKSRKGNTEVGTKVDDSVFTTDSHTYDTVSLEKLSYTGYEGEETSVELTILDSTLAEEEYSMHKNDKREILSKNQGGICGEVKQASEYNGNHKPDVCGHCDEVCSSTGMIKTDIIPMADEYLIDKNNAQRLLSDNQYNIYNEDEIINDAMYAYNPLFFEENGDDDITEVQIEPGSFRICNSNDNMSPEDADLNQLLMQMSVVSEGGDEDGLIPIKRKSGIISEDRIPLGDCPEEIRLSGEICDDLQDLNNIEPIHYGSSGLIYEVNDISELSKPFDDYYSKRSSSLIDKSIDKCYDKIDTPSDNTLSEIKSRDTIGRRSTERHVQIILPTMNRSEKLSSPPRGSNASEVSDFIIENGVTSTEECVDEDTAKNEAKDNEKGDMDYNISSSDYVYSMHNEFFDSHLSEMTDDCLLQTQGKDDDLDKCHQMKEDQNIEKYHEDELDSEDNVDEFGSSHFDDDSEVHYEFYDLRPTEASSDYLSQGRDKIVTFEMGYGGTNEIKNASSEGGGEVCSREVSDHLLDIACVYTSQDDGTVVEEDNNKEANTIRNITSNVDIEPYSECTGIHSSETTVDNSLQDQGKPTSSNVDLYDELNVCKKGDDDGKRIDSPIELEQDIPDLLDKKMDLAKEEVRDWLYSNIKEGYETDDPVKNAVYEECYGNTAFLTENDYESKSTQDTRDVSEASEPIEVEDVRRAEKFEIKTELPSESTENSVVTLPEEDSDISEAYKTLNERSQINRDAGDVPNITKLCISLDYEMMKSSLPPKEVQSEQEQPDQPAELQTVNEMSVEEEKERPVREESLSDLEILMAMKEDAPANEEITSKIQWLMEKDAEYRRLEDALPHVKQQREMEASRDREIREGRNETHRRYLLSLLSSDYLKEIESINKEKEEVVKAIQERTKSIRDEKTRVLGEIKAKYEEQRRQIDDDLMKARSRIAMLSSMAKLDSPLSGIPSIVKSDDDVRLFDYSFEGSMVGVDDKHRELSETMRTDTVSQGCINPLSHRMENRGRKRNLILKEIM